MNKTPFVALLAACLLTTGCSQQSNPSTQATASTKTISEADKDAAMQQFMNRDQKRVRSYEELTAGKK